MDKSLLGSRSTRNRRNNNNNNHLSNAANLYGTRTRTRNTMTSTNCCAKCTLPTKPTLLLLGCLVVLIISSTTERVTFKVMVDNMKPFRFFLTQLIMLIYVPIMFTIVSYKKLRTNDIQPEMEDFSKCKFAFMALLDVIHVTMVTVSGGIIPAPLTVLLLQGAVPATMFTTRFFLGHRYTWKHYIGSFLLLLGMCIHMIPMFESVTKNTTTNNAAQMEFFTTTTTSVNTTNISSSSSIDLLHSNSTVILPTETDVLWNCLIYFMCCVPGALSAIYKEYALQTQPMDMYYLNLWVTFFQFVISIPLAPIGFHFQQWTINSKDHNWSDFRHLFENIGMGTSCWLQGVDPPGKYRDGTNVLGSEYVHCEYALYFVLVRLNNIEKN